LSSIASAVGSKVLGHANEHGISANTRFEACIAKDYPETGFGLVAFFDCLFTTWATWARLLDAGAGAAGIDQPAVRIVVGEQQRAEPRPPPFRIGPADHQKFLAVEAFDLEPQAAIARRVGGIGAFRDDAPELQFAGLLMERRAPSA
jgi:hypothetical protein